MFSTRISFARTRAAAATTLVSLIVLGAGAGLASADTAQDTEFLSALDKQGIAYTSPEKATKLAHAICGEFDRGTTLNEVTTKLLEPGKLSAYNAGYIIGASVGIYCPEHINKLP
jgi:hypothetical protein